VYASRDFYLQEQARSVPVKRVSDFAVIVGFGFTPAARAGRGVVKHTVIVVLLEPEQPAAYVVPSGSIRPETDGDMIR
jgi:hypothetical protein